MNLIELHIIQSFPVTCLNRDDLGAPKSAFFGGVERARISSQCWKRAVREVAHEQMPDSFSGVRSKLFGPAICEAAKACGVEDEKKIEDIKERILSAMDKDPGKKDTIKTLFYCSPASLRNAVQFVQGNTRTTPAQILRTLGEGVNDAADIALFGRMVASDATLTVEGASLFNHALSTHAVRSELDFFSAVDDEKKDADDAGAGQIGTIEYNSACYYRYIGLNLDLLKQSNFFDQSQLKVVVQNFIKAVITANPSARKNSMFGQTFPSYVLGIKRCGQPCSLANAFERPVQANKGSGYIAPSIEALNKEFNEMNNAFSLLQDDSVECRIEKGSADSESLDTFLTKLTGNL